MAPHTYPPLLDNRDERFFHISLSGHRWHRLAAAAPESGGAAEGGGGGCPP